MAGMERWYEPLPSDEDMVFGKVPHQVKYYSNNGGPEVSHIGWVNTWLGHGQERRLTLSAKSIELKHKPLIASAFFLCFFSLLSGSRLYTYLL